MECLGQARELKGYCLLHAAINEFSSRVLSLWVFLFHILNYWEINSDEIHFDYATVFGSIMRAGVAG